MESTNNTTPPLGEFVGAHALLAIEAVSAQFPTRHSLEWYLRRNRDQLAARGALILVAGRLQFHPARFQNAVVEIGRQAAAGIQKAA